jgi:hypothetical protein
MMGRGAGSLYPRPACGERVASECEPGEGEYPRAVLYGESPSPDLLRAPHSQVDLSPQAGRGKRSEHA